MYARVIRKLNQADFQQVMPEFSVERGARIHDDIYLSSSLESTSNNSECQSKKKGKICIR